MSNFLLCLHIGAALLIGKNAYHRGRNPIIWTLLTLIPYGILVTWPLLYVLPRQDVAAFIAKAKDVSCPSS